MSWQEYDPREPTRRPSPWWFKLFNKQLVCIHPNNKVEINYVEPITLLPKTGKCTLCGCHVKSKILWEK